MADVKVTLKRVTDAQGNTDTLKPTTDWDQVENKPSTFTPTAHSLGSHSDVDTSTVADGFVLTYDSDTSTWIPAEGGQAGSVSKSDLQNVYVYGKASVAITKGQAVQFDGAQGDHILIKPAVQSEINNEPTYMIGIAETNIALNEFGYVIVNGRLTLDTTGYTAGSILYFNSGGTTAGSLTATEPTEPNAIIQVAAVSIGGNGNGEFVVRTILITRNIHEINGLQAALDAKATPSDITTAINNLINSAPGALDTLDELAAALGDDANFATTVTNALAGKSDTGHTHDDRYYTETETDSLLSSKSDTTHTHDDRYYTETETDTLLSGKENTFIKNTAFNKDFGNTSGTVTEGNDSRLSDARVPLSHAHGNITNGGAIGTTENVAVITGTGGVLTTTSRSGIDTRSTFPPDSHSHLEVDITDLDKYTQSEVDTLLSGKSNTNHTHTFASLTSKPTTLSGYGITDAYTQTEVNSQISTAVTNLVNGADAAFDTLKEIQDAMATDAELSAAIIGLTIGNGTQTISAGSGLSGGGSFTANQTGNSSVSLSHADTSSVSDLAASGRRYVTALTFDTYGHVTGYSTATETVADTNNYLTGVSGSGNGTVTFTRLGLSNLTWNAAHTHDDRYYTESEVNSLLGGKLGTSAKAADSELLDGIDSSGFLRVSANSSSPLNGNFAIGNASSRNFIQSHNSQPLDINPLGNSVTINNQSVVLGNDSRLTDARTPTAHTHDDRYYTESEVNSLLGGKLGTSAKAADSNLLDGIDSSGFVQITNNSSLNSDSRNTRGVTRLYRRDDNSDFSVQHNWTGSHWHLRGYNGDNFHAEVRVGYSDSAGYASSAGNADTVDGYHASSLWRSDGGTWNPGANISLGQTANGQEWSFDISRNGFTGGYWHVWDSSHGTMLAVNAQTNRVGVRTASPSYALDISGDMRTTGRYYSNEWIQMDNYSGLYSPLNGAHFYPNNATYGSWRVAGSRNGWSGLEFDSSNGGISLMIGTDGNTTGFHANNHGWKFYISSGTMYVFKNTYGGGTQATVWDSVNLTNLNQLSNGPGYVTSSGVTSVATGGGLTGGTITSTGTISHADTSSQGSVTVGAGSAVTSVTLDTYGHTTALSSTVLNYGNAPTYSITGGTLTTSYNRFWWHRTDTGYYYTFTGYVTVSSSTGTATITLPVSLYDGCVQVTPVITTSTGSGGDLAYGSMGSSSLDSTFTITKDFATSTNGNAIAFMVTGYSTSTGIT